VRTVTRALLASGLATGWTLAILAQEARPTAPAGEKFAPALVESGQTLFAAQCGFCHGRDTSGGPTGPDLTESALVAGDVGGNQIGPVVRTGRAARGMPAFSLSDQDLAAVVAYVKTQKARFDAQPGRRRRVTEEDLLSGGANADAGRTYFNVAGGCAKCHSATGDLAGLATRFRGLALMQQLLAPRRPAPLPGAAPAPARELPVRATVTLPSGTTVTGGLAYRDEFTIAIADANGWYRSWPTSHVKFTVTDPLQAHVDLLGKYTEKDLHDVYAYLLTLR
jgi:cytochrome c oxidase cbb3-type subunit 3